MSNSSKTIDIITDLGYSAAMPTKKDSEMSNWIVDANSSNTVEGFIMSLAGVCDGAHSQDQMGFNGGDVSFGHAMARRAANGQAFSVNMANACLKMVRKYQRQLGGKEFIDQWIKQPVFKQMPFDPKAPVATDNNATDTKKNDRTLTSKDKLAVFKSPYNEAIIADIKTIRGEHKGQKYNPIWDRDNKTWQVPVNESSITRIMKVAETHGFEIEQRFKDYYAKVEDKISESRTMLALTDGQNISVTHDNTIMIAVDDPAIMEELCQALGVTND